MNEIRSRTTNRCVLPNGEIQNLFVLGSDIAMHYAMTISLFDSFVGVVMHCTITTICLWLLHQCLY